MSFNDNRVAVGEIVNILDEILDEKLDDLGDSEEPQGLPALVRLRKVRVKATKELIIETNEVSSTRPKPNSFNNSLQVLSLRSKKLAAQVITSAHTADATAVVSTTKLGDYIPIDKPSTTLENLKIELPVVVENMSPPTKIKAETSSEGGKVQDERIKPTSNQTSKADKGNRNSSDDDESQLSFSSASFSSDSEIEGKVSLDAQKSSVHEKQTTKSKQPDDKQDSQARLSFILRDARFYLMKSNNEENIELSKSRSVWSTPPANESRINQAVRETRNVILVYSVKESGKFSGFARLAGESVRGGQPVNWVLPPGLSQRALGGVFPLDWISMHEVSFSKTQHLFNPWNDGKPVKIGRDGQEMEPHVASELCRLFPPDTNTDWSRVMRRSKEAAKRISSVRIVGPIGGGIPSSSSSSNRGFKDGRGDQRGRFGYTATVRHARYDTVRRDLPNQKRRFGEDDYQASKRTRGTYETYYGDRRVDVQNSSRYSQDRNSEQTQQRKIYSRSSANYPGYSTREYHRPPAPPMPYPPPPPFNSLPPPPRYYDVPPLPDYANVTGQSASSSRGQRRGSPQYEKSVSEFLRRTDRDSRKDRGYGRGERDFERRYDTQRR